MIELQFEYFRNMEEVVDSFLKNGYKVTIECLIDKRNKRWERKLVLTAKKSKPREILGETE